MTTMALNPARSGGMTSEERLVIFASSLGTVFEWYDFYIYGTLAVFLAKFFFSNVAGNIAFLADLYHLGRMGEDLPMVLARHAGDIAHIQIADVPDRGAPGTGVLDYEALFGQLAAQDYPGWIG